MIKIKKMIMNKNDILKTHLFGHESNGGVWYDELKQTYFYAINNKNGQRVIESDELKKYVGCDLYIMYDGKIPETSKYYIIQTWDYINNKPIAIYKY